MSEQVGRLRRLDATGVPNLVARLVLGLAFLYMGYNKTTDPYGFLKLIREYQIFAPEQYVWMNLVAIALPWLEVFCGLLLIAGIAVRGTGLVVLGMMLSFTPVVFMRALGIQEAEQKAFCDIAFDCGCGAGEVNICWKLVENTGLTLLAALLVWSRTTLTLTNALAPKKTSVK
ncbi:MAG TPA: DoxX family protein [Phycisphaerae bacterium]|jgi:uncharacterized membrane protein YphA (DoxX/SURF4 family)|nr:DoxX family protein [Phycisphaerae bacterium]HOB75454.1 DoxX family protein [Phycisphaerae bacterium]HOJ55322.1 DoxX family protein [Phycisphaerae bacterium]HOL27390.1 DoxX family protein [Phycisphaerae bacterium]HPP21625.1 DoxX family protein [Phycisphaerae bacterium]